MKNRNHDNRQVHNIFNTFIASDAQDRIERINRILPLSIVGTVAGTFFFWVVCYAPYSKALSVLGTLAGIAAFAISVVCYVMGSGFLDALGSVWSIAVWGWCLCPFYLIDIVIAITAFFMGLMALFCFPTVVLLNARRNAKKELRSVGGYMMNTRQAA